MKKVKTRLMGGKYTLVISIDGVGNHPGQLVWYYRVNEKQPGKMAADYRLESGDRMAWTYRQDVCSLGAEK